MMRVLFLVAAALAGLAWAVGGGGLPLGTGPDGGRSRAVVVYMDPDVAWTPERPGEGRLFRIRVTASEHTPLMGAHGSVAGEAASLRNSARAGGPGATWNPRSLLEVAGGS